MSYLAKSKGYKSLVGRLNRFPQGAPPSELLTRILSLLFTEKEAALVGQLPIRPVSAAMAAQLWGVREVEAFRIVADAPAARRCSIWGVVVRLPWRPA